LVVAARLLKLIQIHKISVKTNIGNKIAEAEELARKENMPGF
jgi:hypothetical protein